MRSFQFYLKKKNQNKKTWSCSHTKNFILNLSKILLFLLSKVTSIALWIVFFSFFLFLLFIRCTRFLDRSVTIWAESNRNIFDKMIYRTCYLHASGQQEKVQKSCLYTVYPVSSSVICSSQGDLWYHVDTCPSHDNHYWIRVFHHLGQFHTILSISKACLRNQPFGGVKFYI